ncbi:DUF6249 domain-containing protein [Chitinophaga sp. 22321]|uniref:DUF6249 domain-containing protein n=1 Tax=Chitinophaga hostae TaxID=2831022 RepID=A0ABS5J1U0_9BACT|nr:DUF6249 domain-containing protein [Chitinophaga hostae]MBS0029197.1 hypothetical protein [Chitinophaga hostae]
MQLMSAALLISVALVIFGISYYYFTTRHRERMSLLEKGLPSDFFSNTFQLRPLLLVLGIVVIGIAVGLLTGNLLRSWRIAGIEEVAFPFAFFLCLGISLVVSYFVLKSVTGKP